MQGLRRYAYVALTCALGSLGMARSALAWAPSGHMQIALLAYDGLPGDVRAALVSLLGEHPRFRQDFLPVLPPSLATQAERARWIFAYASTWPDLARSQPAFEHGTWHYVNLPLYLRQGRLGSCAEARAAFPESARRVLEIAAARRAQGKPAAPAGDAITLALENARRTLGDVAKPRSERALALSWVLHLVGDAHQPLHGVALFTDSRFVAGDRGGNDISISGRGSLHRVWDGLLGDEPSLVFATHEVALLRADPELDRLARSQAKNLDVNTWLEESCELARSAVYTPPILAAVSNFERGAAANSSPAPAESTREAKPEVSLSDADLAGAKVIARRRARVAAARLATLLERVPLPRSPE